MSETDFRKDLFARKISRYLLIFEIISLFISFILLLLKITSIAFALATITLLVFIGIFTWLYIRYQSFPIVQEKISLTKETTNLQLKIKAEINKINNVNQKQSQLVDAEKSEKNSALDRLQKEHINNGLANTRIDISNIPSIGPKLKERLASYGIVTAANINQNIRSIEGFGEAKTQTLLSWRNSIYENLVKTKPMNLPFETIDSIKEKYSILKNENETVGATAETNKKIFEESFKTKQQRLNQLIPVKFITYLSSTFSSNKTVSFLIMIILVMIQCALGFSTGSATIIASLPTLTYTPTKTFTPTFTFTPTITNTPTFTLSPTITFTPTITLSPTITFTPLPTLPSSINGCIPTTTQRETGIVVGIVDGDTIDVRINNQIYRVRYIGIDTPERNELFYNQATVINQQLVFNKTVTLVKDVSETDQFDRLLRYIIVGETFVNYELVNQGYAFASAYPPDIACSNIFVNAQGYAQKTKAGLWMPTPTPYIPPAGGGGSGSGGGGGGNCDPSYPTVCIPPAPPDLDCPQIPYKRFQVLPPDPHGFDRDGDGIGCES